ncbi:hypothetical protein BC830DRAFT_1117250 [Chytriomyces sp. MP71]|nr:hypothetical protein BC830DRAFT_1117250 [Chytriomyces sp. MP71]
MLLDPKREIDVNTLIREYLCYADYRNTKAAFDSECILKARVPQSDSISDSDDPETQSRLEESQNRFVISFRDGDRNEFFKLWDHHFPPDVVKTDPLYQKLEFQVSIYFAVFPIHPFVNRTASKDISIQHSMELFKIFLETRGAELCKTTQFLSFYALPYVPDARAHPSFNEIFTERHVTDLECRLIAFLASALRAAHVPRILRILSGVDMRPAEVAAEHSMELKTLKRQILDHETNEFQITAKHRNLQRDYHNLLTIASELVQTLAACINGEKITASYLASIVQRVGEFKKNNSQSGGSVRNALEAVVTKDAHVDEGREKATPTPHAQTQRRSTPVPQLRASINTEIPANLEAFLDYERIKRELAASSAEVQIRKQAFVLQALRMRLTKAGSGMEKRRILREYIAHDFLGIASHQNVILPLLQTGPHIVCEQVARFLNTIASECVGREYLLGANEEGRYDDARLIPALVNSMMNESRDSLYQQNLLGTLQKLSLRRSAQTVMNEMNVLEFLHHLLENSDTLSDYTCEYGTALFMNLCLRTNGRRQCLSNPVHTLEILLGLLEIDSVQIQTYVNGALYSLLSEPDFRECAKTLRLDESLLYLQKTASEQVRGQINFVLEQMALDEEKGDDDATSEDGLDEDEENEEDNETEEDFDELIPSLPKDTAGTTALLPYFSKKAQTAVSTGTSGGGGLVGGIRAESAVSQSANASPARSVQHDLTRPKTPTNRAAVGGWPSDTNVNASQAKSESGGAGAGETIKKRSGANVPKNENELREFNTGFTTRPKLARTPLAE